MTIKIDQALIEHFISGGFGLPIAHENDAYDPSTGDAYAEIRVFQNDATGLTLDETDETDGLFQIILRYPVNGGAVAIKKKADEVFGAFRIGQQLTYEGQALTITRHQRQPGVAEAGWYKIDLLITYRAFKAR
jgi:hypothetical protein